MWRAASVILALLLLAGVAYTAGAQSVFTVKSFAWSNSAGGHGVYPGSRGVTYTVTLVYNGNETLTGVTGCLDLPSGITPSAASTRCSLALDPEGRVKTQVEPGDVIVFRYRLDVSRSVEPGWHTMTLRVSYRAVVTGATGSEPHWVGIYVSSYPVPGLSVVDAYFEPGGYPGTSDATLIIVLFNRGDVEVRGGHGKVLLPPGFQPRVLRVDLGVVTGYSYARLRVSPVSLSQELDPGTYNLNLTLDVTAVTEDGVLYTTRLLLTGSVVVEQGPPVNITLRDYGFEGVVAPGATGATVYAVLVNGEPGARIEAIYARLYILEGGSSAGSLDAIYNGVVGYGDSVTLRFEGVNVEEERLDALLVVDALVSRNGAEYWVRLGYGLRLHPYTGELRLRVLNVTWASGHVYPGTSGAELVVTLGLLDERSIEGGVLTIVFPECFQPHSVTQQLPGLAKGSVYTLRFTGVSVAAECKPGVYEAKLEASLVVSSGGSVYEERVETVVPLVVTEPERPFRLLNVEWLGGVAYRGSTGAGLRITLLVAKPGWEARMLRVALLLPLWAWGPGGARIVNETVQGSYGYGSVIELVLQGFTLANTSPPYLPIVIRAEALVSRGGSEAWVNQTFASSLPIREPKANLTLLAVWWSIGGGAPGSRLAVELVSLNEHTVQVETAEWSVLKGVALEGGGRVVTRVGATLSYGGTLILQSPPLSVDGWSGELRLCIRGVLEVGDVRAPVSKCWVVAVQRTSPLGSLELAGVEVLYNGAPALLAPGEVGIVVRLLLRNLHDHAVSSVYAEAFTPAFHVLGVSGTCLNGVAPGSTCSLDLVVNVTGSSPGLYPVVARIVYVLDRNGAQEKLVTIYEFNVTLVSPLSLVPRLDIVSAYWGTLRSPALAYPYSGVTPLTLTIVNRGRWEARGVSVHVEPLSEGVEPIYASSACASSLPPGSACTATVYLRLLGVRPGELPLRVRIEQSVYTYGLDLTTSRVYIVRLPVLEPPSTGLLLVDVRWANNWPVYPNTSNAKLRLVIANLWPYSVEGILLTLKAGEGITARRVYVQGPLDPYASVTVDIPVDVANVAPGAYPALLHAKYYLGVRGGLVREQEWRVILNISDVNKALTLIGAWWEGSAAEPGLLGFILVLAARNDEVPEMRGVVVKVALPPGFRSALDNSSVAKAIVSVAQAHLPEGLGGRGERQLASIMRTLMRGALTGSGGGSTSGSVVPRGAFIIAKLRVNIYHASVGVHHLRVYVDFLDQWGSRHVYTGIVPLVVQGGSKLVEVEVPSMVNVTGGAGVLKLSVYNLGEGTIYNVYLTLVPRVPLLFPARSTIYIDELRPGQRVNITVPVYYNPAGLAYWSSRGNPRYASIPFTFSVLYRDAAGYLHAFNVTRPVQLLPFIEIILGSDVRAEYRRGVLTLSGTIVNQGIATARNLEVRVEAVGRTASSFLGDLEPGDQTAFRIDVELPAPPAKTRLVVSYMDDYGRVYEKSYELNVRVYRETRANATLTGGERGIPAPIIAAIPVVALVVSLVVYMLYRAKSRGGEE